MAPRTDGQYWHYAIGARYGLALGYPTNEPGVWWLAEIGERGTVGTNLFTSQSQASRAALRQLDEYAAAVGLSREAARRQLIASHDPARGERRIPAPPLPPGLDWPKTK